MTKKQVHLPILAFFLVSLGGLILHLRIHPPVLEGKLRVFFLVPAVFAGAATFILPFMFNSRKLYPYAYMINLAAVITGTVTMAYFSVTHWKGPVTIMTIVFNSTFPDIVILLAKLPLAHSILVFCRRSGSP
jgi:hypothetical protein